MADNEPAETAAWLPVIGRALAYLCLNKAMEREPKKYEDVLAKVDFLRGIGLSEGDASKAAGSSIESCVCCVITQKGKEWRLEKENQPPPLKTPRMGAFPLRKRLRACSRSVVKDVKNNTDRVPLLRRAGFEVSEWQNCWPSRRTRCGSPIIWPQEEGRLTEAWPRSTKLCSIG